MIFGWIFVCACKIYQSYAQILTKLVGWQTHGPRHGADFGADKDPKKFFKHSLLPYLVSQLLINGQK